MTTTISPVAILHAGEAEGRILKLEEQLSFWGGFNPVSGCIIDQAHPQAGQTITNSILVMPGSRGSAGTPAGLAEALRRRVGPAAILLRKPDVNITTGAQVAARLYERNMPVFTLSVHAYESLNTGSTAKIAGKECRIAFTCPLN